jgi:hypothetical protein
MFGECDSMIRMRSSILSMPFHLVGAKFIWFRHHFIRIDDHGGEIRSFIMILWLFVVWLISWEDFNFQIMLSKIITHWHWSLEQPQFIDVSLICE